MAERLRLPRKTNVGYAGRQVQHAKAAVALRGTLKCLSRTRGRNGVECGEKPKRIPQDQSSILCCSTIKHYAPYVACKGSGDVRGAVYGMGLAVRVGATRARGKVNRSYGDVRFSGFPAPTFVLTRIYAGVAQ